MAHEPTDASKLEAPADLQSPFTCSAAALGRALGISEQAVTAYGRQGIVVKIARGQFEFVTSVQRYCAHLREVIAGKAGGEAVATEAAIARKRLAEALAVKAELANAAAAGRLVDAAAVEAEWSGVLRTVRAGMLAVPSRCGARLPHLSAHDVGEIDAEVRAVLTEVGNESVNS